jgi:prepilin-type N-terminal cleavage/methylation domain-containing protein
MIHSCTRIKKRLAFTLLEILIVIAILGLIAGLIGVNMYKVKRQQGFLKEVDLIVDKLRLAQDLMLIFHGDVHVLFVKRTDNQGLDLILKFDHEIPNSYSKHFQEPHRLANIYRFEYSGEFDDTAEAEAVIKFLSGGTVMSKFKLILSNSFKNSPNAIFRYIHLPGYPAPIFASSLEEKKEQPITAFEEQLTQRTRDEVQSPLLAEEENEAEASS